MLSRRTFVAGFAALPLAAQALPVTRIVFGGDIMLTRGVAQIAKQKNDPASPLADLADFLSAADIAFANLESPFTDKAKPTQSGMVFRTSPDMIEALTSAGIDIVSTANNHSRDSGAYGVDFTLDLLHNSGIATAGTGHSAEDAHAGTVLTRNGIRFGFLGYTFDQSNGNHTDVDPRIPTMDIPSLQADIAAIQPRCDVVIVSMHAGTEYATTPHPSQRQFARAAIDAGAKIVVGHHPHVVQPWENYRDGVIFYSLGNLVFDQFQRVETQHGQLAEVVFEGATLQSATPLAIDLIRSVPRLAASSARPQAKPVPAQSTKK